MEEQRSGIDPQVFQARQPTVDPRVMEGHVAAMDEKTPEMIASLLGDLATAGFSDVVDEYLSDVAELSVSKDPERRLQFLAAAMAHDDPTVRRAGYECVYHPTSEDEELLLWTRWVNDPDPKLAEDGHFELFERVMGFPQGESELSIESLAVLVEILRASEPAEGS
jgi:hypothetical protein